MPGANTVLDCSYGQLEFWEEFWEIQGNPQQDNSVGDGHHLFLPIITWALRKPFTNGINRVMR
jgi:hypothetical protein